MKKRTTIGMLMIGLLVSFLAAVTTASPAQATQCLGTQVKPGNTTGGWNDGSWTYVYDAYCDGTTTGKVTVSWSNWTDANGHLFVQYDMTVQAIALAGPSGERCINLFIDWESNATHEDAQIMRNCDAGSTETMATQTHDLSKYLQPWWQAWPVDKVQVSIYRRDIAPSDPAACGGCQGSITQRLCPSDFTMMDSATEYDCGRWTPNGDFTTKAAKIRSRGPGGPNTQNLPLYPGYDVNYIKQPDV